MKKSIKAIAAAMVVVLSNNMISLAETKSSLQDKIEQNNSNIQELEKKKNEIINKIGIESEELQGVLNEIDSKSIELQKAQDEADSYQIKIDEVQEEINSINVEIENANNEISLKESLIEEKKKEEEEAKGLLENRIRSYYKIDIASNMLYMILESKSLSEFFSNVEDVIKIMSMDKQLVQELRDIQNQLHNEKEEINKKLEEIEISKNSLVEKQEELLKVQGELLVKKNEHESKMNELYVLETEKTSIINSLSSQEEQLENEIGDLTAYNEELEAQLNSILNEINNNSGNNQNNGGTVNNPSSEGFIRPGYGPVTDDFGPRINPVTGVAGYHRGVDFADPYGAPVYASKSGVVAYSGWMSDFGNVVIIDHGGGVQTLYAHNSQLLVSNGQAVSQGEVIAYVGSTGMSTGPHIHFEIRINGQAVNPWNYL